MIFYFLISVVFIAEIIIALAIIINLLKTDKIFNETNAFITEAKPLIKDIMQTTRKLSEQFLELAPKIVTQVKSIITNMIMGHIKSIIGSLTFLLVKTEVEKHI